MRLFGTNPLSGLPSKAIVLSATFLMEVSGQQNVTSVPNVPQNEDGTRNDAFRFVIWGSAVALCLGACFYSCCKSTVDNRDSVARDIDRRTAERENEMERGLAL